MSDGPVMASGAVGREYSMRGARAAAKINNRFNRLIRVDGEAYTLAQVLERIGPKREATVRGAIQKWQRRGEPVTWAKLHGIQSKVSEACDV